jgi:hypothetical protein
MLPVSHRSTLAGKGENTLAAKEKSTLQAGTFYLLEEIEFAQGMGL